MSTTKSISEDVLEKIRDRLGTEEEIQKIHREDGSYWAAEGCEYTLKDVDKLLENVQLSSGQDNTLKDCVMLMNKFHEEMEKYGDNVMARRAILINIHRMFVSIVTEGKSFSDVYSATVEELSWTES
ncbi:hypothetical protein MYX07_03275 [Patescibacteria group bacterium AH-259-L07]|nr:hypothetical protein [Patescibacteria group bacterium AH-259-L07]